MTSGSRSPAGSEPVSISESEALSSRSGKTSVVLTFGASRSSLVWRIFLAATTSATASTCRSGGASDAILFSEAIEAEGAIVFAKVCELGLEGIVSKRAGSRYWSGTSRSWLKSKNPAFVRG